MPETNSPVEKPEPIARGATGGLSVGRIAVNESIDFTELDPLHYWEMRKRLFFIPEVPRELKVPAVEFLLRNRLHLCFPEYAEICEQFKEEGLVEYESILCSMKEDVRTKAVDFEVSIPPYLAFVDYVAIHHDRISYQLSKPTAARHRAVKLWALKGLDAFDDEMKVRFIDQGEFDVPDEQLKPALGFEDLSEWIVDEFCGADDEKCGEIRFHSSPFDRIEAIGGKEICIFMYHDEDTDTTSYVSFPSDNPLYLMEHPKNLVSKAVDRINQLNGTVMDKNIFGFLLLHTSTEPVWINLSPSNVTFSSSHKTVLEFRDRSPGTTLIRICNFLYFADDIVRKSFIRIASHHNPWLKRCFEGIQNVVTDG